MNCDDFDFSPTTLGGYHSKQNYYYQEFVRMSEHYTDELNKLREIGTIKNTPTLVKEWELQEAAHVREKARFYSEIDAYIKKHKSPAWQEANIVQEVEEYYSDLYDDYTEPHIVVKLYAILKDKESIINSDVYKEQVAIVRESLRLLEIAKQNFIDVMKEGV